MKTLRAFLGIVAMLALVAIPWFYDWRAGAAVLAIATLATVAAWDQMDFDRERVLEHAQRCLTAAREANDAHKESLRGWRLTLLWTAFLTVLCIVLFSKLARALSDG